MGQKLKIVSDGTAVGTAVFVDGKPLGGITRIDIQPVLPGQPVRATLSFVNVELDMDAEQAEPLASGGVVPRGPLALYGETSFLDAVGDAGCKGSVSVVTVNSQAGGGRLPEAISAAMQRGAGHIRI